MPDRASEERENLESLEQMHGALFGLLEELVNQAEDLAEDAPEGLVEEDEEGAGAQLWEEVLEKYASGQRDLEAKRLEIGETRSAQMQAYLDDLRDRAEVAFGKKLDS